jgi:glycerophosphoryl diester phosphodiesterase
MTNTIASIWQDVSQILKKSIVPIFTTHLSYTALGTILFAPLIGAVTKLILYLSGKTALSDLDILYFFLTPSGIASISLLIALLITVLVFEQASMMAICAGRMQGMHINTLSALIFTGKHAQRIYFFSLRLVLRILGITLPFLAAATAVAWFLLTDFDINYYLSEQPPAFLAAVISIGLLLLTMTLILGRYLLSWSLALPLILFTTTSPANSFAQSKQLTQSHKKTILITLGSWALAAFLLGFMLLGIFQLLATQLVPLFFDSITILVVVLGGMIAALALINLLLTTLTGGSFSCIILRLYTHCGAELKTDQLQESEQRRPWTMGRTGLKLMSRKQQTARLW